MRCFSCCDSPSYCVLLVLHVMQAFSDPNRAAGQQRSQKVLEINPRWVALGQSSGCSTHTHHVAAVSLPAVRELLDILQLHARP